MVKIRFERVWLNNQIVKVRKAEYVHDEKTIYICKDCEWWWKIIALGHELIHWLRDMMGVDERWDQRLDDWVVILGKFHWLEWVGWPVILGGMVGEWLWRRMRW